MKIKINDEYTVEVLENQFQLIKRWKTESGKPAEKTIGFYASLSTAIKTVVRLNLVSRDETVELKQFVKMFDNSLKEFEKKVKY